jgi:AbrB family looped-hinge helix DNA binding protein
MLKHIPKMWGLTSIGERGQVVIPAKLREDLKIKKGQHFLVVTGGKMKGIMLIPEEKVTETLQSWLVQIEDYKKSTK